MADAATLRGLLERVEKATGPDRGLDLDLARALVPDVIVLRQRDDDSGADPYTYWHFTASLDAALALVERVLPGWQTVFTGPWIDSSQMPWWEAQVIKGPIQQEDLSDDAPWIEGATPALALLAAMLRALIAQEPTDA